MLDLNKIEYDSQNIYQYHQTNKQIHTHNVAHQKAPSN